MYSDIFYTPINLPIVAPNNLIDFYNWYDERKNQVINTLGKTPWKGLCIHSPEGDKLPSYYPNTPTGFDFKYQFPEIWDGCLQLPFKKLYLAHLWEQYIDVVPHKDPYNSPKGPTSFRIMLINESDAPTFYFIDYKARKFDLKLPNDSNIFAFCNNQVMHGSKMPSNGRKVVLWINGELDEERYQNLIQSSIEKYPDYVLKVMS